MAESLQVLLEQAFDSLVRTDIIAEASKAKPKTDEAADCKRIEAALCKQFNPQGWATSVQVVKNVVFAVQFKASERKLRIQIRGTTNIPNAIPDLKFGSDASELLGFNVFNGFNDIATAIYNSDELQTAFETLNFEFSKVDALELSGHSLGGSVAAMLSLFIIKNTDTINHKTTTTGPIPTPVTLCFTSGQPVVTFESERSNVVMLQFDKISYRVVNGIDIVPLLVKYCQVLPPLFQKNKKTYAHFGTEIKFDRDPKHKLLDEPVQAVTDPAELSQPLSINEVLQHLKDSKEYPNLLDWHLMISAGECGYFYGLMQWFEQSVQEYPSKDYPLDPSSTVTPASLAYVKTRIRIGPVK